MSELSDAAYGVADEYRDDRWPGLKGEDWGRVWRFLLGELKRRCPGHADDEYEKALDRGFVDSR